MFEVFSNLEIIDIYLIFARSHLSFLWKSEFDRVYLSDVQLRGLYTLETSKNQIFFTFFETEFLCVC